LQQNFRSQRPLAGKTYASWTVKSEERDEIGFGGQLGRESCDGLAWTYVPAFFWPNKDGEATQPLARTSPQLQEAFPQRSYLQSASVG